MDFGAVLGSAALQKQQETEHAEEQKEQL
jgi:hypothetical protein